MFRNRLIAIFFVSVLIVPASVYGCNTCNLLQFSFDVIGTGPNSSTVAISIRTSSGTVDMAGLTIYFYYDNNETTLTASDDSGIVGAPMNFGPGSVSEIIFQPNINPNVPITHNGYYFYQNIDDDLSGFQVNMTPVTILTLDFDHVTGTPFYGGDGFLASTCEVPALAWVDATFNGHDVCVVGLPGQPLPLELISFDAQKTSGGVQLNWQTATELNSSHFEVQRSVDAKTWQAIGEVEAAGNSQVDQTYFFLDNLTDVDLQGTFLYRLKMLDRNGDFTYSHTSSVDWGEGFIRTKVYPNPCHDILTVEGQTIGEIMVYNLNGQCVMNKRYQDPLASVNLDMSELKRGTYMIQIHTKRGKSEVRSLVVD